MAIDERAALAALDAARSVFRVQIEAHQGRVIDMAGDSILAVFETATGAVTAALAVQAEIDLPADTVPEVQRLRFRIGIHLGDVIEKTDGTVYGDGVNIAARLEGLAEPGGIAVSESIRTAVKGKVSASFEDQGEQTVKNIPDPIRTHQVRAQVAKAGAIDVGASSRASATASEIDRSLPDRPSIAVLPFANMSSDPEQEYFTDGITEDIITELSRSHSLFVIARNSTFTYKGKTIDVRSVGKQLGVRYVVEGSIRKSANRVRVTAQLVDALSGAQIWGERYDRVLEDIFAVQEEVTQSIIAAIEPAIDFAEIKRVSLRPINLTAYEIAVRAHASLSGAHHNVDIALFDQSIAMAKQALAVDAGCAVALRVVARANWNLLFYRSATDRAVALGEGLFAANRLIEIDPANAHGHSLKGRLLMEQGLVDEALVISRHAHELNPNDMPTLQGLALAELYCGNATRAIEHLRLALRISPLDPLRWSFYSWLCVAYFFAKDYTRALESASVAAAEAPNQPGARVIMAVACVGLGDIARAMEALGTARRLGPKIVESRLEGEMPSRDPEHRHRYMTFLRIAAGLEDASAADALR